MAEAVATPMAGKVVDSMFVVAKKEIGYISNCSKNVAKLKNETEKLKVVKGKVQQNIAIATSKGDNLLYGVQEWLDKTDYEISLVDDFLDQEAHAKNTCFKIGLCGNWSTLYHYGKKATKMRSSLLQHQKDGKNYETCVSVDTPAPRRLDVYQNKNLDDILTQNSALGDIISALEDKSIQIIGIYGLGGVGKTTLAMELAARVKNLFANVAFTTVSQTVNVEKVQKDIGEATKRIMKGEKVLIILDDVWDKLYLEELYIPCGMSYRNCKILLTSRNEDVCKKMNAQIKICVDPLPEEEAWILFKRVVGEDIETDVTSKQVAMKVAKECGGLPLLIQAVGNALKEKSIDAWDSALTRLKKPARSDIDPCIKKAYTHLKLSYDYLDSEEVKSCFLLCSMFPEDCNICFEDLVYYGVGLEKFNELDSLADARERVQNALTILNSCGLLLNRDTMYRVEDKKYYYKMHDVVRDVALLIASKGKNKFMVEARKGLKEWLPRNNSIESYTQISLMYNKIRKLPDYELHSPHLNTFLTNRNELSTISNEFTGGMKEARVLDMSWNKIASLPQSLKLLTKLRTLNLGGNRRLCEISVLGELKDLEILILHNTGIKEIPQEIGQLINLRRFDVSYCTDLYHVTPGVISKLCWLEELCIGFFLMHKGVYDSLVEIMNLSKLTYLDLCVTSYDVIPEGFCSGKLNGFVIHIGGDKYHMPISFIHSTSERRLVLKEYINIPFMRRIKKLICVRPITVFDSILNLKNILPTLYHEGFNNLESIQLVECPNVSCLVDWDEFQTFDSSKEHQLGDEEGKTEDLFFAKLKHLTLQGLKRLEVLWKCPDEYISLSNLVTFRICGCNKLERIFSVNVARGLVNLQELTVGSCLALKEVIWGGDDVIIEFPCLAKISIYDLYYLKSFCSGNSTIKYPSLVHLDITYCIRMKKWGNGIQETPNLKFVNNVPLEDGPNAINHAVVKSPETWDGEEDEDDWMKMNKL